MSGLIVENIHNRWLCELFRTEGAVLHWYSKQELIKKIEENEPQKTWFRLVLLEAMLFEPYYPLGVEQDKKGKAVPSKNTTSCKYRLAGIPKTVVMRILTRISAVITTTRLH